MLIKLHQVFCFLKRGWSPWRLWIAELSIINGTFIPSLPERGLSQGFDVLVSNEKLRDSQIKCSTTFARFWFAMLTPLRRNCATYPGQMFQCSYANLRCPPMKIYVNCTDNKKISRKLLIMRSWNVWCLKSCDCSYHARYCAATVKTRAKTMGFDSYIYS